MDKETSAGTKRKIRKGKYIEKFEKLLGEYKNVLVVGVDNVGSLQMQKVRIALRGKAIMIMGKKHADAHGHSQSDGSESAIGSAFALRAG